jgi:chemotaxis-related protein WspB
MLILTFQIGGSYYAMNCGLVLEIVPMVRLREFPKAPPYLLGIFQYRGKAVPVIDLCALAGYDNARGLLSTRIIMTAFKDVSGKECILGLAAERVIETVRVEESSIVQPATVEDFPFLGEMISCRRGLVQCIRPEALMSAPIAHALFPAEDEGFSSR